MDKMNLVQRLSKITTELGVVAKNLEVQQTKNSSYKAVSERDVIDAVKPLETKYGVFSYPTQREVLESHILESESEVWDKFEGKSKTVKRTTYMSRIKTVYRFVNVDDPSDFIETTVFSEGIDTQDKGSGKGMTYADKYALMKVYKISTGDDPDAVASPSITEPERQATSERKATPKQVEVLAKVYTGANLVKLLDANGVERLEDLPIAKASELIEKLNNRKGQNNG